MRRAAPTFATRSAFAALAVESDSDDEVVEEQEEVVEHGESKQEEPLMIDVPLVSEETTFQDSSELSNRDTRPKESPSLSKAAQKRAVRQAKKEEQQQQQQQQQQQKASKRGQASNSRKRARSEEQTSSPTRGEAELEVGRDSSPPGSKTNPLELPAEPETEDVKLEHKAAAKPAEVPVKLVEVEETPISPPTPNGVALHEDRGAPTTARSKDPEAQPFRQAVSSAAPESDVAAGQSQPLQTLVGGQPNGTLTMNGRRSGQHETHEKIHIAKEKIPPSQTEAEKTKKKQNLFVRTLWTLIMISGFLACLALGHAYMILLVFVCQTLVYREVTALFALGVSKGEGDGKDPWSKTLNWYFFAVTNYFLYGESLIYYFKHVVFTDALLLPFATNHRFISFTLYTIGFVGFVTSLQRQYLKSQFGLFCWVHMSLLVIVVSSHFIMNNILEGLIWFWVPASLVICNDIFAYIWGITFGRTPLIKLSPKKTVEGFVGAFFSTIVFGLVWGTLFMRWDYMTCPANNLGVNAFSGVHCTPNPAFVWREWDLWAPAKVALSTLFGRPVTTIPYAPYQLHLLVMSCFASLVAPFGGFFASGFKRAFDIKDFGHSIPGHGGMTDRMDCQFLMGVFTYVYYSSLIKEHHVTVGSVLQLIVSGLTLEEQIELMVDFKRILEGKGVKV